MEIHHKIAGLIIKNGKILLTRKYDEDQFIIPGGKIISGETPRETLARELKEELNVELIEMRFWGQNHTVHFRNKEKMIIMDSYLVQVKGEPKASSEINEFKWLDSTYKEQGIKIASIDEDYIFPDLKRFGLIN